MGGVTWILIGLEEFTSHHVCACVRVVFGSVWGGGASIWRRGACVGWKCSFFNFPLVVGGERDGRGEMC